MKACIPNYSIKVLFIRVVQLFLILFLYYNGHVSILIDQLSQRNVTAHKLQEQQQRKNAAMQSCSLQQHYFFHLV